MLDPASLSITLQNASQAAPFSRAIVLLKPQGTLISYSSHSEDLVRLLLGVVVSSWREASTESKHVDPEQIDTQSNDELAMVECELGRILILPIYVSEHAPHFNGYATPPNPSSIPTTPRAIPDPSTGAFHFQVEAPNDSSSYTSDEPRLLFLLAVNAGHDIPWGLIRAKAKPLAAYFSTSFAEVAGRIEAMPGTSPFVPSSMT